jgi:hypothetical protein
MRGRDAAPPAIPDLWSGHRQKFTGTIGNAACGSDAFLCSLPSSAPLRFSKVCRGEAWDAGGAAIPTFTLHL